MVLTPSYYKMLQTGAIAPNFSLKNVIDGSTVNLGKIKGKKGYLIIFMCNHCPYVKPKMGFINELSKKYSSKGLQVIGVSSNDPAEYSEDSPENMKKVAKEKGFSFPYLFDETQEIAKAYGASCTPDPFLFDAQKKLVYHGRVDDAHGKQHSEARTNELEEAVKELLLAGKVTVKEEPSLGCSIKWKKA